MVNTEGRQLDAAVIGAGAAGLATSRELSRLGIRHVVLERGQPGESWSRAYDSLVLHTGKHMSGLPGMGFGWSAPLFLSRNELVAYLRRYVERFRLPVHAGVNVTAVRQANGGWVIESSEGPFEVKAVVIATGIVPNPVAPQLAGQAEFQGKIRHSCTYRGPEECRGRRVLVVGAGNSAGEIASELGRAGIETAIAVRSGANVVPLRLFGIPIQYVSWAVRKLPRKVQEAITEAMNRVVDLVKGPPPVPRAAYNTLDAIPMIGFHLTDAIRAGQVRLRGGIERVTRDGVVFADGREEPFDEIILATGYRAALEFLGSTVTTDDRGFAKRTDRVTSADQPGLFFVGHNYDSTGALFNIRRDARLCGTAVRRFLRQK
ncbi:MAG TPA: NAD(P)/FAD-dependent oxidoreductase [Thermoanaerobaculia bacterium]|nr:NAD(P)/FAD-dependent oxidoreductase [Thermoanaerobaculia bacterium]